MEPVGLRLDEGVAWVEFGAPGTRNLLTPPLLAAVPRVLAAAVSGGARVVVLRGRGDFFSAGYDIAQIPAELFDADPVKSGRHPFTRCMRAIVHCPVPTLAAVNGHAIGGAVELAASCDLRLARAGARLGLTAARLGLIYPHAGLETLRRLLGSAPLRHLLFTGELVSAAEAAHLGLVDRVVRRERFDAAVVALARRIAANAPLAVQGMKEALRLLQRRGELAGTDLRAVLQLQQRAYRSADFREGRAAFAAKREPRFRGR